MTMWKSNDIVSLRAPRINSIPSFEVNSTTLNKDLAGRVKELSEK